METKIRILIVEDDLLIAEDLSLTLIDLGYEIAGLCHSYAEGMAALKNIASLMPDLVLLDINLSGNIIGEDGFGLATQLRTCSKAIPFIFLTAYSERTIIKAAATLRPNGYLIKPVNPINLFAAIQMALAASEPLPEAEPEMPDYFFVKLGKANFKVLWGEVYCMITGKNYVTLKLTSNTIGYPIRGSMAFVMDELVPLNIRKKFIKITRSVSINIKNIESYSEGIIVCHGEKFENTHYTMIQLREILGSV